MITDVSFEENIHADTYFTREYLEKRTETDPAKTIIVDGTYSSAELQEEALGKNVTLVPTALTGKAPDPSSWISRFLMKVPLSIPARPDTPPCVAPTA